MTPGRVSEKVKHILAADIGGTNSRFGHFTAGQDGSLRKVSAEWIPTKDSKSFHHLLEMLAERGFSLRPQDADVAVFAVPGAVNDEECIFANITWSLCFNSVKRDFGIRRGRLINDFLAQAYGCRTSLIADAEEILPGTLNQHKTQAVIGAGTGLGAAALVPAMDGGLVVMPSEGGHTSLSFINDREYEFFKFLTDYTKTDYIWGDIVVTGLGFSLIHRFLTGEDLTPAEISAKVDADSETVAWFARFYGRSARNFTLDVLATGGVFLSGGVAAKNPILATHPEFEREFRSSPKHGELLSNIPVYLNKHEESGLFGSALYGNVLLGNQITTT